MKFIKKITFTKFTFYCIENKRLQRKEIIFNGGLNIEKARARARKEGLATQILEPKIEQFTKTYEFDTENAKEINND
jgi:hypothetical protein